jgi:hypothetical protein
LGIFLQVAIAVIEDHDGVEDVGGEPRVLGCHVALDVDIGEEEARGGETDLVPAREKVTHEVGTKV